MFCAGCGTQIQSGLNYCSRCGRRVSDDANASRPWTHPLVVAGQTAGVGFVAFIFVMLILSRFGVAPIIFVPLTFFYFAALFGICLMFLRYRSPSEKADREIAEAAKSDEPVYLRSVTTAQLEEGHDPGVGSVTDATTRTLDKVPVRKS